MMGSGCISAKVFMDKEKLKEFWIAYLHPDKPRQGDSEEYGDAWLPMEATQLPPIPFHNYIRNEHETG